MSCAWKLQKRITKLVDAYDKLPSAGGAKDILSTCSKSTKGMMFCSFLIYVVVRAGIAPTVQSGKVKIELPPEALDDIREAYPKYYDQMGVGPIINVASILYDEILTDEKMKKCAKLIVSGSKKQSGGCRGQRRFAPAHPACDCLGAVDTGAYGVLFRAERSRCGSCRWVKLEA